MSKHGYSKALLVVLDGWGSRADTRNNPIAEANTPFVDELYRRYPHVELGASGEYVGLPAGQIGNSEVGHSTIGTGQILPTDLVRISHAAANGTLEKRPELTRLFDHVIKHQGTLHLLGLVSPGGVHSHQEHLYALLHAAKKAGVPQVAVHVFTDGRDTPPASAVEYVGQLSKVMEKLGIGRIASMSGRYYAMDRDGNWDRVSRAAVVLFDENAPQTNLTPLAYLKERYTAGEYDEHIKPIRFTAADTHMSICQGDGALFFNFRPDRARMLSRVIMERTMGQNIHFVTMTQYDDDLDVPVIFPPLHATTSLAKIVSDAGLGQIHIAETEKYAHATYFLNGGKEVCYVGEEDVLIESRKDVATHDLAPEMRAPEITEAAIKRMRNDWSFMFINYANADMVGHTANRPAIVTAIETIDTQLRRLVSAARAAGAVTIITADHGNAEICVDERTGSPHTAHTNNPVPCIVTDEKLALRAGGGLVDVAPTVLELLGLPAAPEMTGQSLIVTTDNR